MKKYTKSILKAKILGILEGSPDSPFSKYARMENMKISLTLKECNIGPNIGIKYSNGRQWITERIFLTDTIEYMTEEYFFDILSKAETFEALCLSDLSKLHFRFTIW